MTGKSTSVLSQALSKSRQALIAYRIPAICLWGFGIAIVIGYYFVPPVTDRFEALGELKTRFGLVFSLISTAIFGGLIPAVIPVLLKRRPIKGAFVYVFASTLFWAFKGLEIDSFYQLQCFLIGSDNSVGTIATKTVIDQALYAPFVGLLNVVIFVMWQENDYSFTKLRKKFVPGWYRSNVLPVLISNWCVWCPAVILIYSLPAALQLPVQNLILCFWVLILVFFTSESSSES